MADSKNIWASTIPATGAAVSAAPLGTTLPTDATTALDAAFTDLGWVGPDGVVNAPKRSTDKKKAWGGETVKVVQTDYTETVVFTLLESSKVVLEEAFGADNVTAGEKSGHETLEVDHSSLMLDRRIFAVDFIDGDRTGRILVREGQVTEIGDIKYVHDDLTQYELTVDCFKPASGKTAVTVFWDNVGVTPGS